MNDTKLKLLCWVHGMQAVVRQAVKGKHKGDYRLECKCWRGATMPLKQLTEQST